MAGVDQHSGYRGDPWGRLARTSRFLAVTTYGTPADARRQIAAVRAVHRRVTGVAPDGRPYAATDPHLLSWVHLCEADCFLRAYGATAGARSPPPRPTSTSPRPVGWRPALGAVEVPATVAELDAMLEAYRPELASTAAARETARYLVVNPPLPVPARAVYVPIAGAAIGLLPRWARGHCACRGSPSPRRRSGGPRGRR